MILAFWIRVQSVGNIPNGQFTENDAYLYYWQAKLISEQGTLPAHDTFHWVPVGRDLGNSLNLYSYVLAYSHKLISLCIPKVSLYHVTLYIPTICFVFGLGVLFIYLYSIFGYLFSSVVSVILATLPGTIIRSAAGFSDRDSWCLLLGLLAITTYLVSLQKQSFHRHLLWTFVSGLSVFLGGLSWEGFGVFSSIILFVELWRFLTSEKEEGLNFYFLWVLIFVPTLYFVSPAYRSSHGFSTHLTAFVLIPPSTLLILRLSRHLFITKTPIGKRFRLHTRTLAFCLTLAGLIGALSYVLAQLNTFSSTTVPLSQNRLMQTVSELEDPSYSYWVYLYGNIFSLGSIGIIIATLHNWKRIGVVFAVPLISFVLTTFGREHFEVLVGTHLCNILFFLAISGCLTGLLLVAWQRNERVKNELVYVAFIAWFILWGALSRDTSRYDFFLGITLAFFTAAFIHFLSNLISENLRYTKLKTNKMKQRIPPTLLKSGIALLLVIPLLFWTPAAHTKRTLFVAKHLCKPTPGNTPIEKAFSWMKSEISKTGIVAASWIYGSQLNVLGSVKTIIDQDHFIQHWIYLYNRYVFCSNNDSEALEFLKTHKATHIMLTQNDILHSNIHAFVGNQKKYHQFKPILLQNNKTKTSSHLLTLQHTPFKYIDVIDWNDAKPDFITTRLKNGQVKLLPYVALLGKQRKTSVTQKVENQLGGVVFYFDKNQSLEKVYYIPAAGWDSLAIRLYFFGDLSNIIIPIYPTNGDVTADVKIWEIRYPPNTLRKLKYLAVTPRK